MKLKTRHTKIYGAQWRQSWEEENNTLCAYIKSPSGGSNIAQWYNTSLACTRPWVHYPRQSANIKKKKTQNRTWAGRNHGCREEAKEGQKRTSHGSQNLHQQNTELTRRRSNLARVYKTQGESFGLRERLVLPYCGEPARDVWPLGLWALVQTLLTVLS